MRVADDQAAEDGRSAGARALDAATVDRRPAGQDNVPDRGLRPLAGLKDQDAAGGLRIDDGEEHAELVDGALDGHRLAAGIDRAAGREGAGRDVHDAAGGRSRDRRRDRLIHGDEDRLAVFRAVVRPVRTGVEAVGWRVSTSVVSTVVEINE